MNSVKLDKKNVFLFCVGLFSITQIRVIGALPLCEIVTIPIGLLLFFKLPQYFGNNRFRNIVLLGLFWFLGAYISDVYNGTITNDILKGLGTIAFFVTNLVFSYWALKDNHYRIIWFLTGAFLSSFLQLFMFTSISLQQQMVENGLTGVWEVWSVYFISPVVLIFAFYYYESHRKLVIALIFFYAVYCIFNMSRNQFLIYSLVGLLLITFGSVKSYKEGLIKQRFLQSRSLRYLFLIFLGLFVVKGSYEYLAGQGYLGEGAYRKYVMQKVDSKLGLASGRKEFWMGLYAVKDSPILGFGSFAKDNSNYALKFLQKFDPDNLIAINSFRYETDIPAHSHIVCAWVWHGLSGLIFWSYIVYLIFLFLWKYLMKDPLLIAFSILMSFLFLWNIFFSPFGNRIGETMRIVFIILSMNYLDKQNSRKKYA